ncbi:MAG: hypothetical protein RMJ19_03295 [Gemmatales bacterium]|nr:hypothetical protein [Gemmatales bacterium]MDW8174674.1 hypothetical protein [Gemmatales bacterium]
MPVMEVKRFNSRGIGSLTGESQITESYHVITDSMISVPEAAAAVGIPLGTPHPNAPTLYAVEIQPQLVQRLAGQGQLWQVDVIYKLPSPRETGGHNQSQPSGGGGYSGSSHNPVDWPMELSISARKEERALAHDKSNPPKPITNSAGCPIDPPLTTSVTIAIIRFTKYYPPGFNPITKLSAIYNKVNSLPWNGFAAKTLLVTDMKANFERVNNFWVWKVEYQLEYKEDKWNPVKVLDHGPWYLLPDGSKKLAVDSDGNPLSDILLDGHGRPLPKNAPPVYLSFQMYDEIDFASHIP